MNATRPAEPPIEHIVDEWVRTFARRIGRPPNEREGLEFVFTCEVTMLRTAKAHLRELLREASQLRMKSASAPKDLRLAARYLDASARAVAWKARTLEVLTCAEATARQYIAALERELRPATKPTIGQEVHAAWIAAIRTSPGPVPEQKPSHMKYSSRRLDSSTGRGDGV